MYKDTFKRSSETKDSGRAKSIGYRRDAYPNQEKVQDKNVKRESFFLSFDHKMAMRRERLREEINEIKRKASLYNRPLSTDNDL